MGATCSQCLDNPLTTVETALIVGGAVLIAWLVFARRSPVAPAPVSATAVTQAVRPQLPSQPVPRASLLGPYAALY